jgi:transposase
MSARGQIVAESYESGESVSAVARRHGLTPAQLFGWRRAARRQAEDGPGENASAFAPVIVEAALPSAAAPRAAAGPRRVVGDRDCDRGGDGSGSGRD